MDNPAILDAIETMIKPLNPPVQAFESSIRTTPFRILISVLLSSRTKDAVTHQASARLFAAAETPAAMSILTEEQIASYIYPVGFYQQKARHIKTLSLMLSQISPTSTQVPDTLEELITLPGVGRKTANLVLALAFNIPAIAVDIHVFRISHRLGWAKGKDPDAVEQELKTLFPPNQWTRINQTLVGFGQTLCKPINPSCHLCQITRFCSFFQQKKPSPAVRTKGKS